MAYFDTWHQLLRFPFFLAFLLAFPEDDFRESLFLYNLHNLHYQSFMYFGVPNHPLVFCSIPCLFSNTCMGIHTKDSENSIWLIF
ncbi:hypothetical protein E1A91_A13G102400v1 [Gossypium mustelinum]|uniref:Secreted protein n=1 Tax=Gossypium mustelinum TaxID=34275 RepID=A0A5D2WGE0_GOSMU|nr:hypothetical protein E1A91_A13G102400v1 [Gossypium mustelinum]